MLLPPELLTLVFLTGLTAVRAQVDDTSAAPSYIDTSDLSSVVLASIFAPSPFPTEDSNDIGAPAPTPAINEPPPEAQPTDDVYPCDLPDPPDWCNPPDLWHPEVTATGWDDWSGWNNDGIGGSGEAGVAPATTLLKPAEQTPVVVTMRTPTVVEIRTNVESSATKNVDEDGITQSPSSGPDGGHTQQQDLPAQPTISQDAPQREDSGGGYVPHESPAQPTPGQLVSEAPALGRPTAGSEPETAAVPAWRQTGPSGNSVLDTIIGHLGKAQLGTQPTQAFLPTAGITGVRVTQESQLAPFIGTARAGQGDLVQSGGAMPGPVMPGEANTASAHNSIAVGNTITMDAAILTLTPGLSTIIGTATDTTLIAIQTDSLSQTIITVSSSGTAITATITNAPATVTLPKTGFEASITGDAGRGVTTFRPGVTAVTTSSKGVANERRVSLSGLLGLVLGVLGFVLNS